ncbi:MAG: bifunctional homocysteine S-methyltransferase/methylenetetrahydrofolate reductase [Anaerolineales bacterium]|jgi:homocysteine S-methyltransferase
MSVREKFLQRLESGRPILMDGAMGTMLHASGESFESCFDLLNLTHPEVVLDIHRAYVEAGADIIETNSFGANVYKLAEHGLEDKLIEINQASVRLARQAIEEAGSMALVGGSMGPLGVRLAPFGRVQLEQARAAFKQQAEALVAAGADVLIIETHSDLYEVNQAVLAAREVSDIPVIASVTFTRDDRTLLGDTALQSVRALVESGADVVGANCSSGPAQLFRIIEQMHKAEPEAHLVVMPNAGWPERVGGRIMYPATPDYFGDYAQAFCQAGASLIGGCCGTTPEHIAAMRQALDNLDGPCVTLEPGLHVNGEKETSIEVHPPTQLASRLGEGRFIVSVEMDPPRGFSTHKLIMGAHLLSEAGADVINVADSPMARMRMSPWAVCQLIQNEVGVESVLHFPTRGRNLLRVQGDLLAAHALGVRNVFVVMGDPTAIGDYPEAMDDYDLVPSGLIKLIKHGFNTGVDHAGADIGEATSFFIGTALNLGAKDVGREIRLLRKKMTAGADFALTQPVYEARTVERFLKAYQSEFGPLDLPILVGLLPLYNHRHAAFLHNEVPGIDIPTSIRDRIDAAGEDSAAEGVRVAIELMDEMRDMVQGVYLMPPFSRYDLAAEIIEAIRAEN